MFAKNQVKNIKQSDGRVSTKELVADILGEIREYESTTGLLTNPERHSVNTERLCREQEKFLLILQLAHDAFSVCISEGLVSKGDRKIGHLSFDQLFRISQVRVEEGYEG